MPVAGLEAKYDWLYDQQLESIHIWLYEQHFIYKEGVSRPLQVLQKSLKIPV